MYSSSMSRKILLATDLTSRSDRATDRALLVSQQVQAELVALHVLEEKPPRTAEDEIGVEERARESLAYDLRSTQFATHVQIATGDPAERALAVAHEHGCELIVTGVARADRLLGSTLGGTVDQLVRTSDIPVLIVTERARAPYANIVAAVDFSPVSAQAVRTVAGLFPAAPLMLFHAFEAPSMLAVPDAARIVDELQDAAQASYGEFVRGLGLEVAPVAMLRRGAPEVLVRQLSTNHALDLVVLGTRGRGRLAQALLGSVAKRILAQLGCDALLVPSDQA